MIAFGRLAQADQLKIEQQAARGWAVLTQFKVTKDEVLQLPMRLTRKATLRAVLVVDASRTWSQGA